MVQRLGHNAPKEGKGMHLSKSKYCAFWQCPKMAWLNKYKPEERIIDASVTARMEAGTEVGELARGLFGKYVDVTIQQDDRLDLSAMLLRTKEEMSKGASAICEAAFSYRGLYCAVDILKQEKGGWAICEVKSSTQWDNPVYMADIAYQKYVLEHCGVTVTGTYLVCLNNEYVFNGNLNLQELFKITDVSEYIVSEENVIEENLLMAETILDSDKEPDIEPSENCNSPYACAFWQYCSKHIPSPSVFDIYRLPFKKKIEYYLEGLISYETLAGSGLIKNAKQLRQIEYALDDKGTYIEKDNIKAFLDMLSYPIYFLDFETIQPVIPQYVGTKPYQQIPFQYSLHYIENEGGELKHKEFLAESGVDPRRDLAERLCQDIPENVCVTAYNKSFECSRIKELAESFPDLAEHLLNIESNIVDLLLPFQSGYYYNRAMGGSFSIKSVLPAIFPNDPDLDYHNLEDIHNGSEAMSIFPQIKDMPPEKQKRARRNLLKYCELDTFAMVKVWEELVRVSK